MISGITIIIPCYNEEENLKKILDICKFEASDDFRFCIVNNGSTDRSLKILNNFENNFIKIINLELNQGYGGGILAGIKDINTEYVGWIHADMINNIHNLKKIINENSFLFERNIVIKGRRSGRNFFDLLFTYLMSFFVFIFTGYFIKDINAQPKIFHQSMIKKFESPPKNFNLDLYLLVHSLKKDKLIKHISILKDDRISGTAKGGGSIKGKIKLCYSTFLYLLKFNYK